MVEVISMLVGYGMIALIILAVIAIIPRWVVLSTESENDPDHIYTIFWEESGYRCQKISSAAGCLFPFILISMPSVEIEGLALVGLISVGCFLYHSSVYRNYAVFNQHMQRLLFGLLSALSVLSFLARYTYLSSGVFMFILISSGLFWGGYAVYKRSEQIRITRRSSKDAANGAA